METPTAPPRESDGSHESDDSESETDDESWAYAAGKAIELKQKGNKPPLIDLDALPNIKGKVYKNRNEKLDGEFGEAAWWVGIVMTLEDFAKFIWSDKRPDESETTILIAHKYDKNRQKAIKFKVEKHLYINKQQIEILDYYLTTKNGYIAWV